MPQIITGLPRNATPMASVSLLQILAVLPDTVPFKCNFSFAGRLLRDGQITQGNVIFYCDYSGELPEALKSCFTPYLEPLGLTCTVLSSWGALSNLCRLYNVSQDGTSSLCLDRATGVYTKLPEKTLYSLQFTIDQFRALCPQYLPTTIPLDPQTQEPPPTGSPFLQDIYLTGSLALKLWTCNDVDLMMGIPVYDSAGLLTGFEPYRDKITLATVRNYFASIMPIPVQVGQRFMLEREPPDIVALKIYSAGKLCLF